MNRLMVAGVLCLTTVSADAQESSVAPRSLDIYWIDVEGGAATLIVAPSGETVLMDAGYGVENGRDARRIVAAMDDAGVDAIDYFIASHFHGDHVDGLPALAARVPIGQFFDHGDSVEQNLSWRVPAWEAYLSVADGQRQIVVPGDTLPLAGLEFTFVTSNRAVLDGALVDSGPNVLCQGVSSGDPLSGENASSLGYLLSLGEFDFLNLGDLTFNVQHELACPSNLVGVVDLFQVPHHGIGVAPQLASAIAPTVAVINNGPRKGGNPDAFDVVRAAVGIQAIWQGHRALGSDDAHNASAERTANLTEQNDGGHWIKATVQGDGGRYVITNGRTGYSETYLSKPASVAQPELPPVPQPAPAPQPEPPSVDQCSIIPGEYLGTNDGCDCPADGDLSCDSDCSMFGNDGGEFCGCQYCYGPPVAPSPQPGPPSADQCSIIPGEYLGTNDGCDCPADGDLSCDSDCSVFGNDGGEFCGCEYCYGSPS